MPLASMSGTPYGNMDPKERQKSFMYLTEGLYRPLYDGTRGQGDSKFMYNIPQEYLAPYEVNAMMQGREALPRGRANEVGMIDIASPMVPYDLKLVQVVGKNVHFSIFSPHQGKAANELTKIFMSQPNTKEFLNASAICRDLVNPYLWLHSYLTACLFREDMKGYILPPLYEIAPDLFFKAGHLREAEKQSRLPEKDRAVVVISPSFTGFDMNSEHKVAYFTEDPGMNSHHWHWHLVNPFNAPKGTIDRKGESFYYMHHNMLARYNSERLSNGINRVVATDMQNKIPEAYFSKLTLANSSVNYGDRQEETIMRDINRVKDPTFPFVFTLNDLRCLNDRICESIDIRFAMSTDGKKVDLKNNQGIDILAGMVEASADCVNPGFYGGQLSLGFHNWGHLVNSVSHDPDYRYKEAPSVMSSTATACRDPVFYRWHYYIDNNLFRRHKDLLPPYPTDYILYNGVVVQSIEVSSQGVNEPNSLMTFWMQSDADMARGLDFSRTTTNDLGPVFLRFTHLQHKPFVYNITVTNAKPAVVKGTVRIFMAVKNDEQGDALNFNLEQRYLYFEMDKFVVTMIPGINVISRKSQDSSLTIPFAQSFGELERSNVSQTQAFCGCGWPDYLLVPKGMHQGMPFDLFCMITDFNIDRVPGSEAHGMETATEKAGCKDSVSFCGIINQKFPDSRPMGFPFDRNILDTQGEAITTLSDFTKLYPNMGSTEIKCFHRNVTVQRGVGAPTGARTVIAD